MAACVVYKCLVHWHAFESERTSIFDYIIEGINDVLKVIHPFRYLKNLLHMLPSFWGWAMFTLAFCWTIGIDNSICHNCLSGGRWECYLAILVVEYLGTSVPSAEEFTLEWALDSCFSTFWRPFWAEWAYCASKLCSYTIYHAVIKENNYFRLLENLLKWWIKMVCLWLWLGCLIALVCLIVLVSIRLRVKIYRNKNGK